MVLYGIGARGGEEEKEKEKEKKTYRQIDMILGGGQCVGGLTDGLMGGTTGHVRSTYIHISEFNELFHVI